MQQWAYTSIKFTGSSLFRITFHSTHIQVAPIELEPPHDNCLVDTLHRHLAAAGEAGWELVNILSYGNNQEWILKRPV